VPLPRYMMRRKAGLVASDPFFADVALLMHMDGANESTFFVDSSSNAVTLTANGNAQISTTESKFGGASAYFDESSGTYIAADASSLPSLDGDFTIEMWVWTTDSSQYKLILGTDASTDGCLNIELNGRSADPSLALSLHNATLEALFEGAQFLANDTWHHVAFSRSSGVIKCFVDGLQYGSSVTNSTTFPLGPTSLIIGAYTGGLEWSGYIDELRITAGVGRYESAFTPSDEPFPDQ